MKKSKFLGLTLIPLLTLTACHGIKKVEFSKFKEEVEKIDLTALPEIEKMSVRGKYESESYNFSCNESTMDDLSLKEVSLCIAIGLINRVEISAAVKNDDAKYYVGMGFKVVYEEGKMEYDKYGYLTLINGEFSAQDFNLHISYKYNK